MVKRQADLGKQRALGRYQSHMIRNYAPRFNPQTRNCPIPVYYLLARHHRDFSAQDLPDAPDFIECKSPDIDL
jgi:hypothetical protein